MSMLITCESCKSLFRFDERLLKGAKGALIKCPRCRERILVRNPAASRILPPVSLPKVPLPAPPTAVDTKIPPIRVEARGEIISPVPPKRHAAGADQSAMIRPDPRHTLSDEILFIPATDPGSVSPEIPGKQAQRVADLFRSPSEAEADRNLSGDDDSSMVGREVGPAWRHPPLRPLYRRPLFISAAISVLLLAGGAIYYVDGNSGRKPSRHVYPVQAQSAPGHPVFEVQNLKGHLNKQATGERLYVIKGTVTNVGKTVSSGIRIQATLLGTDNQVIMQNESYAGNLIDESSMSHMYRVRIEGFLGMRYGEGNANRDIPVGMSLPFMVVFFNPPEGFQSFTVKAMDVDEAEKIQSSDTEKTGTRVSREQSILLN